MLDQKHVWVCPQCLGQLDRYDHDSEWEELDNEDHNVGYADFGRCIECQDEVAELGTGLFIENAIVEYGFTEDGIIYRTTIPT